MIYWLTAAALAWSPQQTPSGESVQWSDPLIQFHFAVDSAPSPEAVELVREAFAEWETASNGVIQFTEGRPIARARDAEDGSNHVGFLTEWEHPSTTLAVTRLRVDSSGTIAEFDLLLQADPPGGWGEGPSEVDLASTLRHEIGHALGLGHSHIREAAMFDRVRAGERRELHADDLEGLDALYGDLQDADTQASCSHVGTFPMWWLALALVRRRRVSGIAESLHTDLSTR